MNPGHNPAPPVSYVVCENAFSQKAVRDRPAHIQRLSLTKVHFISRKFHSISEPSSRLARRVTPLIQGFWSFKIMEWIDAMENRLEYEMWRMGVESPL